VTAQFVLSICSPQSSRCAFSNVDTICIWNVLMSTPQGSSDAQFARNLLEICRAGGDKLMSTWKRTQCQKNMPARKPKYSATTVGNIALCHIISCTTDVGVGHAALTTRLRFNCVDKYQQPCSTKTNSRPGGNPYLRPRRFRQK